MDNELSTPEDLKSIQESIMDTNEKYVKLGLSQLKGDKGISLHDEVKRLQKDAQKSRGTICRSCGQKVQLYKRTLTPEMAVCVLYMLKFYRHSEKAKELQYYKKEDFFPEILSDKKLRYILHDWTKLKYWDIIAPMPTKADKIIYKKGYWSLTDNGIKFAQREIGIPKYAYIYNDNIDSHSSNFVTIDDLLKEGEITYEEIMNS